MSFKNIILLIDHSGSSIEVFNDLFKMGYYVLYVGTNEKLQRISNEYINIHPVTETERFLEEHGERLKKLNISAVYSFLEHAKIAENRIANYLGKKTIPLDVLAIGRDKKLMRDSFKLSGSFDGAYHFIPDDSIEVSPPMNFPFIIKPNLGFASGGVQFVKNQEQFISALKIIRRLNKFVFKKNQAGVTGALCEEFIDGPEYSLDSITVDGRTRSFCICSRSFPGVEDFQDYIYYTPEDKDEEIIKTLEHLISNALSEMGYKNGPSHAEFRYDIKNKRWQLLEVGLRVGFSGLVGRLFTEISGVNYNQLAIRSSQNDIGFDELSSILRKPDGLGVIFVPETGKGGKVESIGGASLLMDDPRIKYYAFEKHPGEVVIPYPKSLDYLGIVIGVAENTNDLENLISLLTEKVVFKYE